MTGVSGASSLPCFLPASQLSSRRQRLRDAWPLDKWGTGIFTFLSHFTAVKAQRGWPAPGGASVLNDSGHLGLTPPPSFSGLRVIYRKRGWDPEGRRKGRLSRVDQEVGIGSSEKHTNFQFKKGLGLFPFTGCWGMSAMTPTRVNLSGGYGGGWPSLAQKAQSIYLTLELVPCKNTAIFF